MFQILPYGIFLGRVVSAFSLMESLLHPQQVSQGQQRFAP